LDGIPPAPRGVPQIEVTFDIDANGILHVSAKDLGTGKEQKITITASSGLSEDEIKKMVQDAEAHASDDAQKRESVELRNRADASAYEVEKFLKENGDKIPGDKKSELEAKAKDLKEALSGNDQDKIKAGLESLMATMQAASQDLYAQAAQQQAGGPDAGGGPADAGASSGASNQGDGEEVIDADFEVVDDDQKK
ncbi:MAG: Hsp70 family protein, partial [Kiritimatiellae bacterium]|nr:Hsp70 family protein [Kiritimatiellia bacterium]